MISSLHVGGAQAVFVQMARWWAEEGNDVTLITLDARDTDHYAPPSGVHRVALDLVHESLTRRLAVSQNIAQVRRLRRELRASAADVIVSFLDVPNIVTLLASRRLGVPVVVCEQVDPRQHQSSLRRPWRALRRVMYPRADRVVVLTPGMRAWAEEFVPAARVTTIPNFVPPPSRPGPSPESRTAVSLGRMVPQKGFDILVRALPLVRETASGWTFVVFGDGPDRAELEREARRLRVDDLISFPGITDDASFVYAQAGMFILPSRFEGLPVALLEAMAAGLPVVAARCPTGPAEVITDGVDGLLVDPEDEQALANGICRMVADAALRNRLAHAARGVLDRFGVESVMARWDELVRELAVTP